MEEQTAMEAGQDDETGQEDIEDKYHRVCFRSPVNGEASSTSTCSCCSGFRLWGLGVRLCSGVYTLHFSEFAQFQT